MASHTQPNPWIVRPRPNPQAQLRLFCFPYAGGGPTAFQSWIFQLPAEIEVCLVQLPGREGRLAQAPFIRMAPLIHALSSALLPLGDRPFALWGKHLGALIAFELARYWCYRRLAYPQYLFASACQAPHLPPAKDKLHLLPEADLLNKLQQSDSGLTTVLEEPERLKTMLPIMRADLTLLESYTYRSGPPLPCPLSVFGQHQSAQLGHEQLVVWQIHTH
ncbi:MAG: thioesterase [Leptolyngbya sp. SIO4C5]|nr:thioesterase [Leptolyngbya sp. SIO4C5]